MNITRFFNVLPVKISIYFVATLIGLAALAGLVLPSIIAWQVPVQIKKKSGHELTLGKPSINPFLLRVTLPGSSLRKPEGELLLEFKQLAIDLSFTRLFKGELEITHFQADDLNLNIALEKGGKTNWQDLVDSFTTESQTSAEKEPNSTTPAFDLIQFALVNGKINFEDRRTPNGYQTTITPIDIELEHLSTINNEEGNFVLQAKNQTGANFKLTGKIDALAPGIEGELAIEHFELGTLATVLTPLIPVRPPEGIFSLDSRFSLKLPPSGLELKITEANTGLNKLAIQSKGKNPSKATLDVLALKGAQYTHEEGVFSIEQVSLEGFNFNHPDNTPNQLASFNAIQINKIEVDLGQRNAEINNISINGASVEIERLKNGELTLLNALNQYIPNDPLPTASNNQSRQTPAKPWTWSINKLNVQDSLANYRDHTFRPGLEYGLRDINIFTEGLTQNLAKPLPLTANLAVHKGGELQVKGTVIPEQGHVDATLTLKSLAVAHAQPFLDSAVRLDIHSGSISSQGKLTVKGTDARFNGDIHVNALRLNRAGTKDSFFQFKALKLTRVKAATSGLTIDRVLLNGLDTRIAIAADKSTNLDELLVNRPSPQNTTQTKGTNPTFPIQVNRFSIANSKLEFEDRSLFIPFGTQIQKLEGVVTGISTKANAVGEIELSGQVNEFGLASAQGQVAFMDPTNKLDLNVQFKNLAMQDLTPYTATFANRKINSGKLNLELNYQITDKTLNSTNRVIVEQIKLGERVQSPDAVDLPLDLAIAILEDSNGIIDLGLPITGSLDDPQFSMGSIVLKAIKNVLTNIVTAPFRALGSLFGADEGLGELTFAAGQDFLSPPEKENAIRLSEALQKRPHLKLNIQGTWSEQDRIALQRQAIRILVAQGLGIKLEPGEKPGPIATQEQATQKVLSELFKKQFGTGEYLSFKDGYKQVNPDALDDGLGGMLSSTVGGVFSEKRILDEQESKLLKGKNFYDVLRDKLQNAQVIEEATLYTLGKKRSGLLIELLQENGISADRLTSSDPVEIETDPKQGIGLNLKLGS